MTKNNQDPDVFSEYSPFRNSLRKMDLESSLLAIHSHTQHQQFRKPLRAETINTPPGYNSAEWFKDFIKFGIQCWELEIIAKELIFYGQEIGSKKSLLDWNQLAKAANKLKHLENYIAKKFVTKENILLEFHRISHRQFHWQERLGMQYLARYWKIYRHHELAPILKNKIEISTDDLFIIGTTLVGFYLDKIALIYPPNLNLGHLTKQSLDKFLDHFSLDLGLLRKQIIQFQSINEQYPYAFNPLTAYPLIIMSYETNKVCLVCPIPALLCKRFTSGTYYELYHQPNFDQAFGNSYQDYIGECLSMIFPKEQIAAEATYGKDSKRTTDWILTDQTARLFIECKTKRLTLGAKTELLDETELNNQLEILANSIVQVYKNILDYNNGLFTHIQHTELPVFPLVVTLENWYLFGDKTIPLLDQKVKDKLKSLNLPEILIRDYPYTVCSTSEFELLVQVINQESIKKVIGAKAHDADKRLWNLDSYLISEHPEASNKSTDLFANEFDDFIKEVSSKIRIENTNKQ